MLVITLAILSIAHHIYLAESRNVSDSYCSISTSCFVVDD